MAPPLKRVDTGVEELCLAEKTTAPAETGAVGKSRQVGELG